MVIFACEASGRECAKSAIHCFTQWKGRGSGSGSGSQLHPPLSGLVRLAAEAGSQSPLLAEPEIAQVDGDHYLVT